MCGGLFEYAERDAKSTRCELLARIEDLKNQLQILKGRIIAVAKDEVYHG